MGLRCSRPVGSYANEILSTYSPRSCRAGLGESLSNVRVQTREVRYSFEPACLPVGRVVGAGERMPGVALRWWQSPACVTASRLEVLSSSIFLRLL